MSRVFFILSILILFVQNIFSADKEINLEKYIFLKDTQWTDDKKNPVTDEFLLNTFIPQLTKRKDKSITIIEVDGSSDEGKLYDILELKNLYDILELKNIPLALDSFLPIVNFQINFNPEDYHGTNSFNNININPILKGQKISFNIATNEFKKLKDEGWLWYLLNFDKIKVSSIHEKNFVLDSKTKTKYALTQDISTNNIVVVKLEEKHLTTLRRLNPKFKIVNLEEEEIKIEINQINNISKENNILDICTKGTKVYFKDIDFGYISNVENSTISIKIDNSFCPTNKFVCLHDSISFIKWDDIVDLELKDQSNSVKRGICKKYKDYFPEEIKDYFEKNKLAPKIKIKNNTNNNIFIVSVKFGTNTFANVDSFNKEIDKFSLNNQSTIKVEYQADNKCPDCKEKNLTNSTGELNYDIYSQDDVIEISLNEIDTSNLSNPKVKITNPPEGVDVYFNGDKVTTNTIDVPIHAESIELEFKKEGYETYPPQVYKFDKLHFNDVAKVNCKDVLSKMTPKPWPKITINNIGTAKTEVSVDILTKEQKPISIGTEELKSIPIASDEVSIDINNITKELLAQDGIFVLIKCDENKEQKFYISRGGNDISVNVEGIEKLWVNTLTDDKKILYLSQFKRWAINLNSGKPLTQKNAKDGINEFVKVHNISKKDLLDLLTLNEKIKNEKGDCILSRGNRDIILKNLNNIKFEQH